MDLTIEQIITDFALSGVKLTIGGLAKKGKTEIYVEVDSSWVPRTNRVNYAPTLKESLNMSYYYIERLHKMHNLPFPFPTSKEN